MKKYTIYLTGGQTIEIFASKLKIIRDHTTGMVQTLYWYDAERQFRHLNPQNISAIVEG